VTSVIDVGLIKYFGVVVVVTTLLPHDAYATHNAYRGISYGFTFVCLSDCPSHVGIVSKQLNSRLRCKVYPRRILDCNDCVLKDFSYLQIIWVLSLESCSKL